MPHRLRHRIARDTCGSLACLQPVDDRAKRPYLAREIGDNPFEGVEAVVHVMVNRDACKLRAPIVTGE